MRSAPALSSTASRDFEQWLSSKLQSIPMYLKIGPSSRVSKPIEVRLHGFADLLSSYRWRTEWQNGDDRVSSENWETTKRSLTLLGELMRSACLSDSANDDVAFDACRRVLKWGGDRSAAKGASVFLQGLQTRGALVRYLKSSRNALCLDDPKIEGIRAMNSMLTKVHALLSPDGLPIYDSRVAAAIAALAEIFRREANIVSLPRELHFPAVGGGGARRSVFQLFPDSFDPGTIRYGQKDSAIRWASAKVRLGRLLRRVLQDNPEFLSCEGSLTERMRGFEAALFMIGYDVQCLRAEHALA